MSEFELDLSHIVKKPSEMNEPELMLLYGRAGSGKTWLASSAALVPELAPILIIDTEGSTAGTVAHLPDELVDIVQIDTHEQFEEITEAVLTQTHKYNTVIIDTLDVAQDRGVKWHLDNAPLSQRGEKNTMAAWGNIKTWTIDLARRFKAAKFFSIFVMHEAIEKTETGALTSNIVLAGGAKDVLPGVPDFIGLVSREANEEGEEVTSIYVASGGSRAATKNRFSLPPEIENPTMQTIFDYIKENNK